MTHLASFFPPENMVLELDYTSTEQIFTAIGMLFENNSSLAHDIVTQNLLAREQIGSTALGAGVAIPHGRIKGLKQPVGALMRLTHPIAFDAPDGEPVTLFIFLLVPEHATQQHLEILSEIAQLLSDPKKRQQLATETNPAMVHQLLTS